MTGNILEENNAGKGRPKGSRNKLTEETLALVGEGESPLKLLVKVSQDANNDLAIRLNAARWAAPYLHPKPFPDMPTTQIDRDVLMMAAWTALNSA